MNNKRTLVYLYEDIVLYFLYDIVYQQQHKSRDSNQCFSGASSKFDWFKENIFPFY